jgi:hypothetical protein
VDPANEHGVTWLAVVGGDRDGYAARVDGDQPAHRRRPDERLVCQGDHGGPGITVRQCPQSGRQRGAHASQPVGVMHADHTGNFDGNGPGHDDHRIRPAVPQQRNAPFGQR